MQRVLCRGQDTKILFVEQASAAERFFHALDAGIGQLDVARELIERVMDVVLKPGH